MGDKQTILKISDAGFRMSES
jgi:flagellar biogenesis protein FliO